MNTADKGKHCSIAFPAVGTGGLGIPASRAAQWMLTTLAQYNGGSVQEARIVLYDRDKDSVAVIKVLQI